MTAPIIVGAGLAGLIAAHAWPNATVLETGQPAAAHKALLRFRTDAVARLCGLEFRSVKVRKGLWVDGEFVPPSIALANAYSRKVLGRILPDRSVWNLEASERFIAPEDIYDQMVASVGNRILWGADPSTWRDDIGRTPIVTTAPLPATLDALGLGRQMEFHKAPIVVRRWRVPECDTFQTVYFPQPDLLLYRASITGSLLIAEFACATLNGQVVEPDEEQVRHAIMAVQHAFGLADVDCEVLAGATQRFGKIAPVDDVQRKAILGILTKYHGVFSLGRFATWRNILLDDVVQDIDVLKRLMRASTYDQDRILTQKD